MYMRSSIRISILLSQEQLKIDLANSIYGYILTLIFIVMHTYAVGLYIYSKRESYYYLLPNF